MIRSARLAHGAIKTYINLSLLAVGLFLYIMLAGALLKLAIPWVLSAVFYFLWRKERRAVRQKTRTRE